MSACPNREPFEGLAVVLAGIDLDGERPEGVKLCKSSTKLDGNILKQLGAAQRNFWIVRHIWPSCDFLSPHAIQQLRFRVEVRKILRTFGAVIVKGRSGVELR
jgi:hypothetical protein